MNCKPKELARVVPSSDPLSFLVEDRIVRTIELVYLKGLPAWTLEESIRGQLPHHVVVAGEGFIPRGASFAITAIPDCYLRPIRGDAGTDEIIRIAGRPVDQRATDEVSS